MNPLEYAKAHPLTAGAIAVAIVGGGWLLFGGSGGSSSAENSDGGWYIGGADPGAIAANNALLVAQQESADRRFIANLDAQTRLAERAYAHEETRWNVDATDARSEREMTIALGTQSVQLAALREQERTTREVAQLNSNATIQAAQIQAGVDINASNNARRANRDNNIGGIIRGGLAIVGGLLGI